MIPTKKQIYQVIEIAAERGLNINEKWVAKSAIVNDVVPFWAIK